MSFLNRLLGGSGAAGHPLVSPADYKARYIEDATPHTLVDVRTVEEYSVGYIPGAIHISLQDLQREMNRIPKDKPVIVYCRSGKRSAFAANLLVQAGYPEVYDLGGIIEWARQGMSISR